MMAAGTHELTGIQRRPEAFIRNAQQVMVGWKGMRSEARIEPNLTLLTSPPDVSIGPQGQRGRGAPLARTRGENSMIFGTLTPSLPCTYGAGASNCQMGISGADARGKDAKSISAGLMSLLLARERSCSET